MGHYDFQYEQAEKANMVGGIAGQPRSQYQIGPVPQHPIPSTTPYPTKMSEHLIGLIETTSSLRERITVQMNKLVGADPADGNVPPIPAPSSARDALQIIDHHLQAISYQLNRIEEAL